MIPDKIMPSQIISDISTSDVKAIKNLNQTDRKILNAVLNKVIEGKEISDDQTKRITDIAGKVKNVPAQTKSRFHSIMSLIKGIGNILCLRVGSEKLMIKLKEAEILNEVAKTQERAKDSTPLPERVVNVEKLYTKHKQLIDTKKSLQTRINALEAYEKKLENNEIPVDSKSIPDDTTKKALIDSLKGLIKSTIDQGNLQIESLNRHEKLIVKYPSDPVVETSLKLSLKIANRTCLPKPPKELSIKSLRNFTSSCA
jgi:hypothetical protein